MLPHLNYNHKWFKVNIPDKTYQCERYEDLADEMNSYTNEFYFSFHEQLHKNVYPASQVSYTKQKHYKKCQIPINSWINACISNAPEIISCQHYNYFMFTFFFFQFTMPPFHQCNFPTAYYFLHVVHIYVATAALAYPHHTFLFYP